MSIIVLAIHCDAASMHATPHACQALSAYVCVYGGQDLRIGLVSDVNVLQNDPPPGFRARPPP